MSKWPNGNLQQIEEAATPEEMRIAIHKLSYYNPLVKLVFNMADINGLKGEDRFTLLAYMALRDLIESNRRESEYFLNHSAPLTIRTSRNE